VLYGQEIEVQHFMLINLITVVPHFNKEVVMDEIAKVLFGAVIGFLAAMITDHLKLVHASRTAAMMIVRELEFHKLRLNMAVTYDLHAQAEYGLKFPSTVWLANSTALLAGAPSRETEPLLNWYASLAVLGYELHKRIGSNGPELTGPDRARLQVALTEAYSAAQRISVRWTFNKNRHRSPSLFEEVIH
jgi:hypothetical protein